MGNLTTTNQRSLSAQSKKQTFSVFMGSDAIKNKINQIVGGKNGQRFITSIISAVSTNPALSECEHSTILSSALLGESLGLSPSPQLGQYYMVPFKDKKRDCKVATFQLGYKGYIQLAIRSGYYKKLNVLPIKEGELINFNPLEEEINCILIEDDDAREKAQTIGYYAMFEYENGFKKSMYWSKKKMMAHADRYSQAFNAKSYELLQNGKIPEDEMWKYSSFWYKSFDEMAMKTMLRQLISKWGIMSIEMQTAFEKDNAFIDENGNAEFIEQEVEEPQYTVNEETGEVSTDSDDPFAE